MSIYYIPLPYWSSVSDDFKLLHAGSITVKYIYMAGPLGPMGGGMLRVTDYLIQAKSNRDCYSDVELVKLDTRGTGNAAASIWVLIRALSRIIGSRVTGRLAGVHVNMAERLSVFRKGILLLLARLIGTPTVLHLHAAQMESYYHSISRPAQLFTKCVFKMASQIIVLGDNARAFLVGELGLPSDRVTVVMNGVPSPSVQRTDLAVGSVPRRTKILFLGNLWERKGAADLLQAVADPAFDPAKVEVIIAGGGDVDKYKDLSRKLGLESLVNFIGWVDQRKAAEVLANADVLILPSYDEGLPLVILEALANSIPVVCTPVGEIPTVLRDGVDAVFVKPGDIEGIREALLRVSRDEGLRASLAANGRRVYDERFSLEKFSQHVSQVHAKTFHLGR